MVLEELTCVYIEDYHHLMHFVLDSGNVFGKVVGLLTWLPYAATAWSSSTAMAIRSGSLVIFYCDMVLADGGPGGPDFDCVFMAGLVTLLGVDLGVLDALPALDLVDLDADGLDSDLICLAFNLEVLVFFAEMFGLGLDVFAKDHNLDFVFLFCCCRPPLEMAASPLLPAMECPPSELLASSLGYVAWKCYPLEWTGIWRGLVRSCAGGFCDSVASSVALFPLRSTTQLVASNS